MKIRMDFVTNSSSSSFILARKEKLNDKQKNKILEYVEKNFLGKIVLTPESTEEEIQKVIEENGFFDEDESAIRKALQAGKTIYSNWVCFEDCICDYSSTYEDIWEIMSENSDGDFEAINGDLSY